MNGGKGDSRAAGDVIPIFQALHIWAARNLGQVRVSEIKVKLDDGRRTILLAPACLPTPQQDEPLPDSAVLELADELTASQREIVRVLAGAARPMQTSEIERKLASPSSFRGRAGAARLMARGVIEHVAAGYRLTALGEEVAAMLGEEEGQ